MGLFQLGNFVLSSGGESNFRLECDSLTDDDWSALAQMVRQMVGPFSSVEGVPRGGRKLAAALEQSWLAGEPAKGWPHLIVDDVLTTGRSMDRLLYQAAEKYQCHTTDVRGAVVFARGPCPSWIRPVFQCPRELWLKPRGA